MRKAVALCGIGALKKEQPAVTAICSFRYYIKGLIRKTEGPFIITRSLCLYGIIVSVQQVSAFTALTVRKWFKSDKIHRQRRFRMDFSSNCEGYWTVTNYFSAMHACRSFPALPVRNSEGDKSAACIRCGWLPFTVDVPVVRLFLLKEIRNLQGLLFHAAS